MRKCGPVNGGSYDKDEEEHVFVLIKVQLTDKIGVSCDDHQDPTLVDLSNPKTDPDREEGRDNPKHSDQFCRGQEKGFTC